MKNFLQSFVLACLGAIVLTSCQPEVVGPQSNQDSPSSPDLQANYNVHPELFPMCGEADYVKLMSEDGSLNVNYCGFLPCSGTTPEWGTVAIRHGMNENEELTFAVDAQLAFGWVITEVAINYGNSNNWALVNGMPDVNSNWEIEAVNPVVNSLQFRRPAQLFQGCNDITVRFKVGQFSFFGGLDQSSERYLWIQNPEWNGSHTSNSLVITPYCVQDCNAPAAFTYPTDQCAAAPAIPSPSCTQVKMGGGININSANDVICVAGGSNIGTVNFNGPGTLIIDAGVTVSGGINANNGGNVIVRGTFNWNASANINGNFKLYVAPDGTLNRSGDLTMNNQNNLLVNLGEVNINNNLTYTGKVHNGGIITAQGLNVNSNNSELSNTGLIDLAGFANVNSGTRTENCGTIDVQNNFQMNGQSEVRNYCTILARGYAHSDGELHNYGIIVGGLQGGGTGFNNQGNTYLYEGSNIVTKNFYWSPNRPLTVEGNASVMIAESAIGPEGNLTSMSGNGKLRLNNGVQLHGNGTLNIADMNPNSNGDNPSGNWANWPSTWENMVNAQGGASVVFRALDPANDVPPACN